MAEGNQPVPATDESPDAVAAPEEQEAPKKSRLLVILLPLVLVGLSGGGWLAYSQYARLAGLAESVGLGGGSGEEQEEQPIEYGQFMEISNIIINPSGSQGRRYLMISIGLESADPVVLEDVSAKDVVVRDTVLKVLGARTVDELAAIDRRNELKDELRGAVNDIVGEGAIDRLYFTQYVLQ